MSSLICSRWYFVKYKAKQLKIFYSALLINVLFQCVLIKFIIFRYFVILLIVEIYYFTLKTHFSNQRNRTSKLSSHMQCRNKLIVFEVWLTYQSSVSFLFCCCFVERLVVLSSLPDSVLRITLGSAQQPICGPVDQIKIYARRMTALIPVYSLLSQFLFTKAPISTEVAFCFNTNS